jgi:hypothetical protein
MERLCALMLAASLTACALVPPPPSCADNGEGLRPVNPMMLSAEQIQRVEAASQNP